MTREDRFDLDGTWWASWQTVTSAGGVITTQQVTAARDGDLIDLRTVTRGVSVADGGYHWRGQLRAWPGGILIGWYAADDDDAVEAKGSLYFTVDPAGSQMTGRWVGLGRLGGTRTGAGALAREKHQAAALVVPELVASAMTARALARAAR